LGDSGGKVRALIREMTRTFSFPHIVAAAVAAAALALAFVPAGASAQGSAPPSGSPVQAGPPMPMPGRGRMGTGYGQPGPSLEMLIRELNLTDAQKTSVNALLKAEHDTLRGQMEPLRQAHQALDAAILRVPTDDYQLQSQVQQVTTIESQLALDHARTEARIFQLLDAEQQQKARQLIADASQRGPRPGRRG
jgi:Spy/CpxP family protein refolding chaperone